MLWSQRILLIAVLFVTVLFQNCGLDIGGKGQSPAAKGLRGNGEPYVGNRPDPGTYYSRKSGVKCDASGAGAKLENVEAVMRIDSVSDTAEVIDNCTGASENVALADLESSEISRQYVSFENKIYEQFEKTPAANEPIPVLMCQYPKVSGFLGVAHIVVQIADEKGQGSLVVLTHFALSENSPQSMPPNFVTAMSPDEYPQGVPAMHLSAQGMDILFSGFTPDGVHHPSAFAGTVGSRQASGEGLCIDVQKLSQKN